jgi:hypothetical protein
MNFQRVPVKERRKQNQGNGILLEFLVRNPSAPSLSDISEPKVPVTGVEFYNRVLSSMNGIENVSFYEIEPAMHLVHSRTDPFRAIASLRPSTHTSLSVLLKNQGDLSEEEVDALSIEDILTNKNYPQISQIVKNIFPNLRSAVDKNLMSYFTELLGKRQKSLGIREITLKNYVSDVPRNVSYDSEVSRFWSRLRERFSFDSETESGFNDAVNNLSSKSENRTYFFLYDKASLFDTKKSSDLPRLIPYNDRTIAQREGYVISLDNIEDSMEKIFDLFKQNKPTTPEKSDLIIPSEYCQSDLYLQRLRHQFVQGMKDGSAQGIKYIATTVSNERTGSYIHVIESDKKTPDFVLIQQLDDDVEFLYITDKPESNQSLDDFRLVMHNMGVDQRSTNYTR